MPIDVKVQFSVDNISGKVNRKSFTAEGQARWKEDPPEKLEEGKTVESLAEIPDRGTVDVTYEAGEVRFFATITQTKGKVSALANANREGFDVSKDVTNERVKLVLRKNNK